jgi:TRAP-type C4-dicarboxylate transport system substrate-binding protein
MSHYYDTQAWLPKNITIANKAAFDKLDKATQEAVLKAAAKAEQRGWKMSQDKTAWYGDQLKAHGMKVQPPGETLKTGLKSIGDQLTADWLKRAGPDGQTVVDSYKKM